MLSAANSVAQNPPTTYAYQYDGSGNVLGENVQLGDLNSSHNVVLTSAYDYNGNRTQLAADIGGTLLPNGLVAGGTADFTNAYHYDALGNMTSIEQTGSGVTPKYVTLGYDGDNRLTEIDRYNSNGPSNLAARSNYTYDADSDLTDLQTPVPAAEHHAAVLSPASYNADWRGDRFVFPRRLQFRKRDDAHLRGMGGHALHLPLSCQLGARIFSGRFPSWRARERLVQFFTQVDGGLIERLPGGGRPKIKLVARGAAVEAAVGVAGEVRRERACCPRAWARGSGKAPAPGCRAPARGRSPTVSIPRPCRFRTATPAKVNACHEPFSCNREEEPVRCCGHVCRAADVVWLRNFAARLRAPFGHEGLAAGRLDRAPLAGGKRRRLGQPLAVADRGQGLDRATPPPGRQLGLPSRPWPAALAPLSGGLHPQLGQLAFGAPGDGVAVGLVALEHQPADHGQLPRRRHHGHVAGLLLHQAAEEVAQGPGVLVQMLRGLDEHPAGVAVAALGDRAVVAVLGRLLRGRHQAQVGWRHGRRRGSA